MIDTDQVPAPGVTQRVPEVLLDIDLPLPRQEVEPKRFVIGKGLQHRQAVAEPGLSNAL